MALFQPILTKQENKAWLSPEDEKCRTISPKLTNKKGMILLAFTADNKLSVEVTKPTELANAITGERYVNFIRNTSERWRRLHPTRTKLSAVWWQHENARPHKAFQTTAFLQRRDLTLIQQSPYSPDLNQCDAWLFAALKKHLRQHHFANQEEILPTTLKFLRSIPDDRFLHEIHRLVKHCKCS